VPTSGITLHHTTGRIRLIEVRIRDGVLPPYRVQRWNAHFGRWTGIYTARTYREAKASYDKHTGGA
jgi:hypothetical protein